MPKKVKSFDLHWLGGKVERVEGFDIADAMTRAGYGNGAVRALDYYAPVKKPANKACSGLATLVNELADATSNANR